MQGAYVIDAICDTVSYIFMAKISLKKDGKHKSKVKNPDSIIKLIDKNCSIIASKIVND